MRRAQNIVIGSGFVGCAMALSLARLGITVKLIDIADSRTEKKSDNRRLVLSHSSVDFLKRIGIWPSLQGLSHSIKKVKVLERGRPFVVTFDASELGVENLGVSLSASLLLSVLRKKVSESPLINSLWKTEFKGFKHPERLVELNSDGKNLSLDSEILFGADGINSKVRDELLGKQNIKDYRQVAISSSIEMNRSNERVAYQVFNKSGSIALIPAGGNTYVGIQCVDKSYAKKLLELDDDSYRQSFLEAFGDRFGNFLSTGARISYPLLGMRSRLISKPGVIILGNACNTLHPVAAQGLNLAFRDVSTAMTLIKEHAADEKGFELRYSKERKLDHLITTTFTDFCSGVFKRGSMPFKIGRTLSLGLISRNKRLRVQFARRMAGLSF